MRNLLKLGKNDFALITTHAKLDVSNGGARKGFSFPMKGITVRTFNVHPSKSMNLPSRVKGLASNRKMWKILNMII